MTFAISSVNGQLGRAVVAAFTANQPDAKLVGLARSPSKAADLQIEVRPGDYDDQLALTQSLLGVDTVLMIQGIGSGIMDNPSDFDAVTGRQHQTWDDYFASIGPES